MCGVLLGMLSYLKAGKNFLGVYHFIHFIGFFSCSSLQIAHQESYSRCVWFFCIY